MYYFGEVLVKKGRNASHQWSYSDGFFCKVNLSNKKDCLTDRRSFKDYGLSEADPEGREIINKEKDEHIQSQAQFSMVWHKVLAVYVSKRLACHALVLCPECSTLCLHGIAEDEEIMRNAFKIAASENCSTATSVRIECLLSFELYDSVHPSISFLRISTMKSMAEEL
ncbi:hypothetical protein Peur_008717 [Populus x canadensis]